MPKVSVIIPVYGVEQYIERCARSLFEQTLDDIEYLFIDDCTPDKSVEVLKKVLEEYPNRKDQVIIHRMEQNSGQAAVRKWGMQNATGEYVIHCDSDDWIDKTMYEKLYNKAIADDCDIVYCDYYESDGTTSKPYDQHYKDNAEYLMSHYITAWIKLTRRSLWQNEDFIYPKGDMGEDRVFTVQLVHAAMSFGYVPEYLYYYFINPKSLCHELSHDKAIKNFKSRQLNTDLICNFYEGKKIIDNSGYLTELKLATINWLSPYLYNHECSELWNKTYPGLLKGVMTCRRIPLRSKFAFVKDYIYVKLKY